MFGCTRYACILVQNLPRLGNGQSDKHPALTGCHVAESVFQPGNGSPLLRRAASPLVSASAAAPINSRADEAQVFAVHADGSRQVPIDDDWERPIPGILPVSAGVRRINVMPQAILHKPSGSGGGCRYPAAARRGGTILCAPCRGRGRCRDSRAMPPMRA